KYAKPGNVFCGVAHRLDRPVGGLVIFAKTSKALARMNEMFRNGDVKKTYWAITKNAPPKDADTLTHYITSVEKNNKSYASLTEKPDSQKAILMYRLIGKSDRYNLLEINLLTGRKHQIRVQLSSIGCPIKGDLKYGSERSNPDGGISLLARRVEFTHPVSGIKIDVTAPIPNDNLWKALSPED
ncbi:MAG: RNA pseudouridine synthase, partial [Muribaculaceae bacterium]